MDKRNDPPAAPPRSGRRAPGTDFVRAIVEQDLKDGRHGGVVVTRFPPEPNGYLHIGHGKAMGLDFGIAQEYGGRCHLRFDDTNPETEETRYVDAIKADVRWMGYDWGEHLYFASDYFERIYDCAEVLVKKGKAYVDSQNEEEIRENRGSITEAGRASPYRERSVEENLDLLRRMRAGEFENGSHVLRALIDMAHPNMVMRDPVLYRIRHASHYRRGDAWCLYPLYDFAHCLEDAFEGVTHSLCTLEFEPNRAIYDWLLDEVGFEEPRTHQYEFSRGKIEYTVLSKRRLLRLVNEGHVSGWDDPRMPTIAALRRRGVPPEAIRTFWEMVGVSRADTLVDLAKLEFAIRDHLNPVAPRVMGVLRPLKLVITNYPADQTEWMEAPYFPRDVGREGTRQVPFSRELWIERDDFELVPPEGFHRMAPGEEVRLRYGYVVRCQSAVVDPNSGEVVEVHCTYDPETRGGSTPGKRRIAGTLHWVSIAHALPAEVHLYDRLFSVPDPDDVPEGADFTDNLNPDSHTVLPGAFVEPSVASDPPETRYQFERTGYFWRDPANPGSDRLVFNRIVTLRDRWSSAPTEREAPPVEPSAPVTTKAPDREGEPPPTRSRTGGPRDECRSADPELAARLDRYAEGLGLSDEEADVLSGSRALSDFFEEALTSGGDPRDVAAWVVNELPRVTGERDADTLPFGGKDLGVVIGLVADGRISRPAAREVLGEMAESGGDPQAIVRERGLERMNDDGAIESHAEKVLAEWPEKIEEYRGGKVGLLGFFVGQVMKATGGRAEPERVREILFGMLAAPQGGSE